MIRGHVGLAQLRYTPKTFGHGNLRKALREASMASITIRNLEIDLKRRLRRRAAKHGHSIEEEVRDILLRAVAEREPRRNLVAAIRSRIEPLARVNLGIPVREMLREPPHFIKK